MGWHASWLSCRDLRADPGLFLCLKPPKKDEEDFINGDEEDYQHEMSALHASRSAAHHELAQRSRTRTNGTVAKNGPIGNIDLEKARKANLDAAASNEAQKQEYD